MPPANAKLLGRVAAHFAESAQLKQQSAEVLGAPIVAAGLMLVESLRSGGKALACGHRGSGPPPPRLRRRDHQSLRGGAPAARCARADYRYLDADLDRQRLRVPAGLCQAAACS